MSRKIKDGRLERRKYKSTVMVKQEPSLTIVAFEWFKKIEPLLNIVTIYLRLLNNDVS